MSFVGTTFSSRPFVGSTDPASPSPPSAFLAPARDESASGGHHDLAPSTSSAAAAAAQAYTSVDIPRSEEDITQYILYDGLPRVGPSMRHARERQKQAYLNFTHRIHERLEAAHAIVLSANPLSLSVMASQLRMYRWTVTEAQTLLETTSLLQDFVMETTKHGYRVRRRPAAPLGQSRYAHGRGKQTLMRIAQEERDRLVGSSGVLCGAAATSSVAVQARTRADQTTAALKAADGAIDPSPKSLLRKRVVAPPEDKNGLATGPSRTEGGDAGAASSEDEEVEEEEEEHEGHEEDRLPLPPPDALPRLVLVDGFTHEDFADIARHVRFVDKEHGLELLLVLLLSADPTAAAVATQGAGCVITPAHETTIEDAYKAGYDLVLAHNMDHLLVDFLTTAFVSSVGRWRNDVRSKAAVGNYMSVRDILLGGLDTATLQQLVWDDNTDDAKVLELLGAQSLAVHGDAKRYGKASRQLLSQQQQQRSARLPQSDNCSRRQSGYISEEDDGEDRLRHDDDNDDEGDAEKKVRRVASSMMSNVPRLRGRPTSVARFGVRLPADQQSAQVPLTNFGCTTDVLSAVMGSHVNSRRGLRRRDDDDDDDDDDDFCADGVGDDHKVLHGVLEKELGRLLAENDGKQASIDALQKEVEELHRTVAVLKRNMPGADSGSGTTGADLDSFTSPGNLERLDSEQMVHLGKQQQIYILKERLETANDRIAALLKDDHESDKASAAATTTAGHGRGRGTTERGRGGGGSTSNGNQARMSSYAGVSAAALRREAAGAIPNTRAFSVYRQRACETYQAHREAEMMALFDDDAHCVNAALAQLPQLMQSSTETSGDGGDDGAAADGGGGGGRGTSRASSAMMAQRKEREATDKVIHSLQAELQSLQGRLDDTGNLEPGGDRGGGGGDLQARMATHLQAALERLEAERQRVRHLEELRQTDQLLLTHAARLNEHVKRQLSAARRAEEASDDGSATGDNDNDDEHDDGNNGPRLKKGRRGGKGGQRVRGKRKAASAKAEEGGETERGEGARKSHTAAVSAKTAKAAKSKSTRGAADSNLVDPARVEGLIAAAVTEAVADRNRVFRRQLGALAQTCKAQLTRVLMKHQKPRTIAYVQMLQEELEQAKRDQRGAFMRLQFTLCHLRPDQYDAASIPQKAESSRAKPPSSDGDGDDDSQMIPLRAVMDADVRRAAERVAREHAAFALRAAYMTAELQRLQRDHSTGTAPAISAGGASTTTTAAAVTTTTTTSTKKEEKGRNGSDASSSFSAAPEQQLQQLLQAYHHATQQVKEAIDGARPIRAYLDAVQVELEAEQRLSPWCDVDCAQLFRSPAMPPAPHLALVPINLGSDFPSASTFAPQSTDEGVVPLLLADVDGSVRDLVGVYGMVLRSFASIGEGSSNSSGSSGSSGGRNSGVKPARRSPSMKKTREQKTGKVGGGDNARKSQRLKSLNSRELHQGTAGHLDEDDDEDDNDLTQPLITGAAEVFSVHHALSQLPVEYGEVSQYQGRLDQLYTSDTHCSPAQRRLYETLLRAYQQHCINPVHMAIIETTLLTTTTTTTAATAAALTAGFTQHREVLALLNLMAPTATPALLSLHQQVQQAQRLLDAEENNSDSGDVPRTSAVFLTAVDAALLACVVDELRWRQWQRTATGAANAATAGAPETLLAARATCSGGGASHDVPPALPWRSPTQPDDAAGAAEDVRVVQYYTGFCAARARAARGDGVDVHASDGAGAADLFDLSDVPPCSSASSAEAYRRLTSLLPNLSTASASAAGVDSESVGCAVARELAEYFSKRQATIPKDQDGGDPAAAEAAFLTDVYLNDSVASGRGPDGGGGVGDSADALDDNVQAIRRLRKELEYMEALKMQRMKELAMRCEWRLRGRHGGDANNLSGKGSPRPDGREGGSDSNGAAYPAIDPERLNFKVKSGTAAWYGIEAAKRVRAILRRRARPEQIIVEGGPEGGGVGVELSRRTATAAAKTHGGGEDKAAEEDERGYQVEEEGDYRPTSRYQRRTSTRKLPMLASSLSQQQQRLTATAPSGVAPLPPLRGAQATQQQQQPTSYVSPRDAVSMSAYVNLAMSGGAGGYQGACLSGAAEDLSSRVQAYRAELTRAAAGQRARFATTSYANGAPFSLPLASPVTGTATTAVRLRPPLPQQTSWVYGVPTTAASALVQQQASVDPRQTRDMVLFMPPRTRSSLAEAAERGRPVPRTFASSFAPQLGAAAAAPFTSPAALAAQRLQTMLNASMEDPSVVGVASAAAAGALRTRQFAEQQRLQLQEQQRPQEGRGTPSTPSTPSTAAEAASQRRREPPRQQGRDPVRSSSRGARSDDRTNTSDGERERERGRGEGRDFV